MRISRTIATDFGFGGRPAAIKLTHTWVNPNRQSPRVGSVDVEVTAWHLRLSGCNVTQNERGFFVQFPRPPMVNAAGAVLKDDNGKWQYKPSVVATNKELPKWFSDAVLAVIRAQCPEMLGGAR